jgi:hypothetical protein
VQLQVSEFRARTFDLDHVDLFWKVSDFFTGQPTDENILAYTFQVLRSESPAGPWDALTKPFQDQYYFRDASPALLHKWRKLYYLLRVTYQPTNEVKDFGPTGQLPEPDLIALEIMRQEDVLFREFAGRKCWLFPVKTFGPKCICFDRVKGKRTRSNCVTCYDTGYLGGFLSPVECYVQIDPSPKSNQQTPLGEQQTSNASGRLISFPPIRPDDILIEAENRRWKVVTVAMTTRLRAVVHQELTLHEIPIGDVEYKLPINIADLTTMAPSAERNFTNPQHVDADSQRMDFLAVYGYKPRGSTR